jgi:hypothetical protein
MIPGMELPEKPLVAGMSTRSEDINRVYFFERSDGQVIACEEVEAWSLYSRRQQVLGRNKRMDFKLIGVGDGLIYREALSQARIAGQTDIKKAQEIIRKGQEDELDACRGKIIAPRDMDKIG